MKTAFLFAGQGAQNPGMGKEIYEADTLAKAVFDSIHLDIDIKKLCFEGPKETLDDTQIAQPAIFVTSMALAKVLHEYGVTADAVAGLSLGEYSALCYANAFSIQDGAAIVRERGKIMANALPAGTSSMYAILMLEEAKIKEACEEVKEIGVCEIANYNCPGQIVITGEKAAVDKAKDLCIEKGARRAVELAVSGAFHSSLLNDAADKLRVVLSQYDLKKSTLPVYHNISGKKENLPLIDILSKQIAHSVYFEQTIANMLEDGFDTFVEIGPGKTISGFVKKCCKGHDVKILHVEDLTSLKECVNVWKG